MSETKQQSVLETADSVTGLEEDEILEQFGQPLETLQLINGAKWARALVYVLKRRAGAIDVDAKAAVQALSIKDIWAVFEAESVESGKDEPELEQQPESSPPSVS